MLFTALLIACGTQPAALPAPRLLEGAPTSADVEDDQAELSMEVIELMCSPCAAQIVSQSRLVPGVTHVSMVLATKTLTVRFDPERITRQALIASVEQIVATIQ